MTDERRALLTDREREILAGDADVTDNYRYSIESRVRNRLRERLSADIETLREHESDIFDELVRPVVCDAAESPDSGGQSPHGQTTDSAEGSADTLERPVQESTSGGARAQSDADRLGNTVDVDEFPQAVDSDDALVAIQQAREFISNNDGASKKEIVQEIIPDHPLGYDADDALETIKQGERYKGAWWRRVVRPGLQSLEDVQYENRYSEYRIDR